MRLFFSIFFLLTIGISVSQAQFQVLTGGEHGTYRELAEDMNKIMPRSPSQKEGDTTSVGFLEVISTVGSSINFSLLIDETHPAKVAIMQLDFLLKQRSEDVLHGTSKTKDLMVLMPLNIDAIHVVAKQGKGIGQFSDLKGRSVAIGNKKEGTYYTALFMQEVSKVFFNSKNISTLDVFKPLLLDEIDAFIVVATPPLNMIKNMPVGNGDKYKLVSVENINGWADRYTEMTIPAGTYQWQTADVKTFGVPSIVVVNMAKITEEEKQALLQWRAFTIENLETLKQDGHNAWKAATLTDWDSDLWPQIK